MRARRASIITRGKFDVLKKEGKKGKQNGGVTRVIENRAKEREEKETGNMIKRRKKKGAPPLVVKLINDMSHPVVVIIVGNLISANQHAA